MSRSLAAGVSRQRRGTVRRRDPAAEIGSLIVTDNPMGAVLSVGMFLIVWSALPIIRPFLIAAIGLGVIFAAVVWVRRR